MLPSTKRHELLAYGPRGGRAVAKTAAEMAAAVNAGRVHNRLAGYVGQPHDALEPRHVKGVLTLMLVAGELPAAATLHLLFPDGEPRYAIVGAPRWACAVAADSALTQLTRSCRARTRLSPLEFRRRLLHAPV